MPNETVCTHRLVQTPIQPSPYILRCCQTTCNEHWMMGEVPDDILSDVERYGGEVALIMAAERGWNFIIERN